MLTKPRAAALHQGRQDRGGGINAGEHIGDRHAHLLRLPLRLARHRHQTRHALDDEIIACAMRIGAGLAKSRDRAIDQFGVDRVEAGIVEPIFRQPVNLEVFDQHIGIRNQAMHDLFALGRAEIGNHTAFSAVGGVEIGGRDFVVAGHKGRAPAAGVIAFGGLDLNHIRAQIGKGLASPRACQNPRKFDDLDPCKRRVHHLASSASISAFRSG